MPLDHPEMMLGMPETTSTALMVEALRQINASLSAMNSKQAAVGIEIHTLATQIAVINERDVRYAGLVGDVSLLRSDIVMLKSDKDRRDGALKAGGWVTTNWVALMSMLLTVTMIGAIALRFAIHN